MRVQIQAIPAPTIFPTNCQEDFMFVFYHDAGIKSISQTDSPTNSLIPLLEWILTHHHTPFRKAVDLQIGIRFTDLTHRR